MSQCPKCQAKLHIYNISQFCPSCGINMRFYNFEEKFEREAKLAELSQAGLKVMLRNLKYSFSGSKLVTAKLIVMLLPVLSLLIPSGYFIISMPFVENESHFGILGLVNAFTGNLLPYIFSMTSSEITGTEFTALRNALFCYIAVALFAVLCFVFSVLGFISIKNMHKFTTVFSALGIVTSIISIIMNVLFISASKNSIIISSSFGFGLIITAIMFAVVFAVNLLLWKTGIHPVYDEGVIERVEIYKQVKTGKIDIDSLPQPVVVTEATKKIDEEIAKEEAAFYESMKNKSKEE